MQRYVIIRYSQNILHINLLSFSAKEDKQAWFHGLIQLHNVIKQREYFSQKASWCFHFHVRTVNILFKQLWKNGRLIAVFQWKVSWENMCCHDSTKCNSNSCFKDVKSENKLAKLPNLSWALPNFDRLDFKICICLSKHMTRFFYS